MNPKDGGIRTTGLLSDDLRDASEQVASVLRQFQELPKQSQQPDFSLLKSPELVKLASALESLRLDQNLTQLGLQPSLLPQLPLTAVTPGGKSGVRRPRRRKRGITSPSAVEEVRGFLDRQDESWGQEKLAEKANLTVESIGRLLAGQRMDRKTWAKVARVMRTRVRDLFPL